AILRNFADAWDRHDAERLAELWLDDGVLNHPWGWRAVGRQAVRELLAREHQSNMAVSRLQMFDAAVDHVRPGIAVVDVDGVLHDVRAPHGRLYDLTHHLSAVFAQGEAGEWRIQTMTAFPNA
ncbi:MAG TPA: nuclear transport factor 2 family protein, partial [Thermoanaerobaculia bacterium]